LDAAEVSRRKSINSKLDKIGKLATELSLSLDKPTIIEDYDESLKHGVKYLEMPSFSHLQLDDLKKLAVRLRENRPSDHEPNEDEIRSVKESELHKAAECFKGYVKLLSKAQRFEQKIRAAKFLDAIEDRHAGDNMHLSRNNESDSHIDDNIASSSNVTSAERILSSLTSKDFSRVLSNKKMIQMLCLKELNYLIIILKQIKSMEHAKKLLILLQIVNQPKDKTC
jgi:hypothetical protein